jgi:hypothetical protein
MTPGIVDDEQVAFFRTFGFVVLRNAFEPRALAEELDRSLDDAFPSAIGATVGGATIRFRYLPMMCQRTPASLALVDRLAPAAAMLLGAPVLPVRAKGVVYSGATSWHSDSTAAVASVGFAAYLEPLDAESGALRVLPGSHRPELGTSLEGFTERFGAGLTEATTEPWVTSLPAFPIPTRPGDVIAFDEHLRHASAGGRVRRQWRVDFVADPLGPEQEQVVKSYLARVFPSDWDGGYDVDRYPSYGEHWLGLDRPWIDRLGQLGAYDAAATQERFARSRRANQ